MKKIYNEYFLYEIESEETTATIHNGHIFSRFDTKKMVVRQ